MKKALLLFIIFLSACIPSFPGASLHTSEPTEYLAPTPTSTPIGDSFILSDFIPQYGVLIDSWEDKDGVISLSFWIMDTSGYVSLRGITSDYTVPGRERPVVVIASNADRQTMFTIWKKSGFTARVTDINGKSIEVSNVFLINDPPSGYHWSNYGIAASTSIRIVVDGEKRDIEFGEISDLVAASGELILTLHNGSKLTGVYTPDTVDSKPFQLSLYGVQYGSDGIITSVSMPFEEVTEILFLASPVQ
jgi:hypothetical protein